MSEGFERDERNDDGLWQRETTRKSDFSVKKKPLRKGDERCENTGGYGIRCIEVEVVLPGVGGRNSVFGRQGVQFCWCSEARYPTVIVISVD
jgi:hypothetical protein